MSDRVFPEDEMLWLLVGKRFAGTELQLVLALVRLTWAEGRERVQTSLRELAARLNSSRPVLSAVIKGLMAKGVIHRELRPGETAGSVYWIERDVSKWRLESKEPELRVRVLERDSYTCSYCGDTDRERMTVDHIVAKSMRGPDEALNMTAACVDCNIEKSSLGAEEFFRRHRPRREWIRGLIARLTPWEGDHRAGRGKSKRRGPPIEVGDLPPASDARRKIAVGRFVCPIFEEACARGS